MGEDVQQVDFTHCWWECKTGSHALENNMAASYKFKHKYAINPTTPLLGIALEK